MATITRNRFSTRLHPQYIKDSVGEQMVVLSQNEYQSILEEIDDWKDSMLYLQTKGKDSGERISMKEVFV